MESAGLDTHVNRSGCLVQECAGSGTVFSRQRPADFFPVLGV